MALTLYEGPGCPKIEFLFFRQTCILVLCSKTSKGPGNPNFFGFFWHFYNFWVKVVEKNFGLVRISKKYVFWATLIEVTEVPFAQGFVRNI